MGKLLDNFLKYLENTPEEQIKADWNISDEQWSGMTVGEFMELIKQQNGNDN